MNKTLAITTIALIAVVMGMSTIAPTMVSAQVDDCPPKEICDPEPTKAKTPLKQAFALRGSACELAKAKICVAVDHDDDGICDSKPVNIPDAVAKKLGIDDRCQVPFLPRK